MLVANYAMSPSDLWRLTGTANAPLLIDVRRRDAYESAKNLMPGSAWHDPAEAAHWLPLLPRERAIVVTCKAGHELSQSIAAQLRSAGCDAAVLSGGYAEWAEAKLPLVDRAALERLVTRRPSVWVTRRRPKIDRVACPWLIRRFLDPQATILFVDPPEVPAAARETGGVPFDIDGVELSHEGPRCTFDTMLRLFGLESEPSLARLALIVRGADTARPDLAPEAAGLHAVSLGLSELAGDDDHGMLQRGFLVYDALFTWLRYAASERHNWPAHA